MNYKETSLISFALAAVLALIASRFLVVNIADADIFDLIYGFFLLLASMLSLSFGISKLIK